MLRPVTHSQQQRRKVDPPALLATSSCRGEGSRLGNGDEDLDLAKAVAHGWCTTQRFREFIVSPAQNRAPRPN